MSMHWAKPGELGVGFYQVSSIPFVTASYVKPGQILRIEFPTVTRFVQVRSIATGSLGQTGGFDLRTNRLAVGFTQLGLSGSAQEDVVNPDPLMNCNYVVLMNGEEFDAPLRLKNVFLSGAKAPDSHGTYFQVLGGTTEIGTDQMITLTGSNSFTGVG